jgi:hypothetical protein
MNRIHRGSIEIARRPRFACSPSEPAVGEGRKGNRDYRVTGERPRGPTGRTKGGITVMCMDTKHGAEPWSKRLLREAMHSCGLSRRADHPTRSQCLSPNTAATPGVGCSPARCW